MKPADAWADDPLGLTDPVALIEQVQRDAIDGVVEVLVDAVPQLKHLPLDVDLLARVLVARVREIKISCAAPRSARSP